MQACYIKIINEIDGIIYLLPNAHAIKERNKAILSRKKSPVHPSIKAGSLVIGCCLG